MIDASKFPHLAKMQAVTCDSQKLGHFIEWLGEQGLTICKIHSGGRFERYVPNQDSIEVLLAKHFEIDLKGVEKERQSILNDIRSGKPA